MTESNIWRKLPTKKTVFFLFIPLYVVAAFLQGDWNAVGHVPPWKSGRIYSDATKNRTTLSVKSAEFECHIEEFKGQHHQNDRTKTTIAIGCAITSLNTKLKSQASKIEIQQNFPIFSTLLPSFCKTYGRKFEFHFYFAYDADDIFFTDPKKVCVFREVFQDIIMHDCPPDGSTSFVGLHMVECTHSKHPAWAQNDAIMEAYLDNMEYFYRINDDTKLETPRWAETFIQRLRGFIPPNVGVVGPANSGGSVRILTYDFTHRSHIDMFGFHYPREFGDWYADDWITSVYKPGRMQKVNNVTVEHTRQLGQRYQSTHTNHLLGPTLQKGKEVLNRYIQHLEQNKTIQKDPTKVIVFNFNANNQTSAMGMIRNAQIARLYFPGWTIRIYTLLPGGYNHKDSSMKLQERYIRKLQSLGAEIRYIEPKGLNFVQTVVMDTTIRTVLFRNPRHRISNRQSRIVDKWLNTTYVLHTIKDHVSQPSLTLGLLGIKLDQLRKDKNKLKQLLEITREDDFEDRIWTLFQADILSHDSVGCNRLLNRRKISEPQVKAHYEGQEYDEHMRPVLM